VQDVLEWKQPRNVTDIQSFLGLARYYRQFIEKFSKIAKLMTELLKNRVKFERSQACEEAFQTLKHHLTTAPVLAQPNIHKDFDVYCDASRIGLGCVLMQEGEWWPTPLFNSSDMKKIILLMIWSLRPWSML
jgi:hypothetical protein